MTSKKSLRASTAKAAKKLHPATLVLAVIFLAVGSACGIFASEALTAEDRFTLNGGREIRLACGQDFDDPGVTVVSFGRDISAQAQVGGDADRLDTNIAGTYYLVYTVNDLRWGDYQLVRTVIVSGTEPGGAAAASGAFAVEEA